MAEYVYRGPGPEEHDGELARPGDVREFDADPGWGLWERLEGEPDAPPPPAVPAAGDEPEGGM
jgi:hypothetical protein